MLNTDGVQDYDELTLNSTSGNISIEAKEIPVMGAVNLEEVRVLGS